MKAGLPGEEAVLVLAPGVGGCSESRRVPGAMAGQSAVPRTSPPGSGAGTCPGDAGTAGQRELISHRVDGASSKLKAKQELYLKADSFADFEEQEVFRKKKNWKCRF